MSRGDDHDICGDDHKSWSCCYKKIELPGTDLISIMRGMPLRSETIFLKFPGKVQELEELGTMQDVDQV